MIRSLSQGNGIHDPSIRSGYALREWVGRTRPFNAHVRVTAAIPMGQV